MNVLAYDFLGLSAFFLVWRAAFKFGFGLVCCFLGIVTGSESESVWWGRLAVTTVHCVLIFSVGGSCSSSSSIGGFSSIGCSVSSIGGLSLVSSFGVLSCVVVSSTVVSEWRRIFVGQ